MAFMSHSISTKQGLSLAAFCLFALASVSQAQSLYRLFDDKIAISPATGQTALSSYLLRFGIFTNNFTPTVANFSQWNANFVGATGTFDGQIGGPVLGAYAAEFSASNNSVYPLGAQLYMVVYNVAPSASVASATRGVILTRTGWTVDGPETVRSGGRTRSYLYYYDINGMNRDISDLSEWNVVPVASVSAFSSPVNTFSLGSGGVLQTSFDLVPEPSSASLVLVGLAGVWAARRRK